MGSPPANGQSADAAHANVSERKAALRLPTMLVLSGSGATMKPSADRPAAKAKREEVTPQGGEGPSGATIGDVRQ
jgi:hypothetical protein